MKKKFVIRLLIIIFILILSIIANYADTARVATNHEPKFCIKIVNHDGSKITYWGLGYKVIRYVGVSPNEPYENNIGAKMGSWFMKYELATDVNDKTLSIHNIDDFYHTTLTQDYDIRTLTKTYSSFDAQKDNCFVIGTEISNQYLYQQFMENYKNGKSAFIRVAQTTIEGDLILYDILYHHPSHQLYLVTDNTRDSFTASENKNIELKQFENMVEYEYQECFYWVLYNHEISPETFESEEVFKIPIIQ